MPSDDDARRVIEKIQRQAAEAQARANADMAAVKATMDADLARAKAHADKARADYEAIIAAEIDKLRARGITNPDQFYRARPPKHRDRWVRRRDAHAKGRELAAPEWERLEREMTPRRETARARLAGPELDREMLIIDAEIDAKVALRAAEIATEILTRGTL